MNPAITFFDGRQILPRHPTRTFDRRHVQDIQGIVTHHTAGSGSPESVCRYHVQPNHVCSGGCPGGLYTFMVYMNQKDNTVDVWWVNDLEAKTFSQGGHGSPVEGMEPNRNFLGIALIGNFYSHANKTGDRPHIAQVFGWMTLIGHLLGTAKADGFPQELWGVLDHTDWSDLYGHVDFGKPACPGDDVMSIVSLARDSEDYGLDLPDSAAEWQRALLNAGYDLGRYGRNGSGVDGKWGQSSKAALVKFQREHKLPVTGHRDAATAKLLAPYHVV